MKKSILAFISGVLIVVGLLIFVLVAWALIPENTKRFLSGERPIVQLGEISFVKGEVSVSFKKFFPGTNSVKPELVLTQGELDNVILEINRLGGVVEKTNEYGGARLDVYFSGDWTKERLESIKTELEKNPLVDVYGNIYNPNSLF